MTATPTANDAFWRDQLSAEQKTPCPLDYCLAQPGWWCVTRNGAYTRTLHVARMIAWRESKK